MADDDKELFNSAMTDDTSTPAPEPEAPQPEAAPEAPQAGDRPRDEHGRFAPKQPEEPQPEPALQGQPAAPQTEATRDNTHGIPPWRLREEAEARRAAEDRARQYEQDMASMRQQLAQLQQQNKQPETVPDIFEDPNAFVDHGVRQAIDPVQQRIQQITEFQSQQFAVQRFGEEKVTAAFNAMDQALRSRDPEAATVRERMKTSIDPYGDMVKWNQRREVVSKVGDDPDAFVEKTLEERLKDPAYAAKLLEKIRGNTQSQTRPSTITQLPPSLTKATAALPATDDAEDNSEAGLLKSALRR